MSSLSHFRPIRAQYGGHVIHIDQSEAFSLASDLRLRHSVYSGAVFKETRHTQEPIRARRHFETVTTLKWIMKYHVEVETDSRLFDSPGGSGYGTPSTGLAPDWCLSWNALIMFPGRGTPSRQLNWAIEVDIARLVLEPGTERRERKFSRQTMEQDEVDMQRALRKKSRKVRRNKSL